MAQVTTSMLDIIDQYAQRGERFSLTINELRQLSFMARQHLTRQPAPEEAQPAQAVATTPVAWLDPAYPRYVMCSEHEIPGWSPLYIAAPPATSEDRDTLVMLLKDAEARADFLMDYLERHGLLVAKFCKPPNAPTEDWWVLGEPHMVKGDACEGYGKTPESAIRAAMAASSATEQGGGE